MKKRILMLVFGALMISMQAQYKMEEKGKNKEERIFPKQKFDSIEAKKAIAYGTTTINGVAFTKPRNNLGFKAPLADRIYANHIMVELFPLTPYFEEWYNLKKKEENIKRKKYVFMDTEAYRYRLTCETNSKGEFVFPKMKPGKYVIMGTLPYNTSGSYDKYSGSGYNNYGGRTDYYDRQYYTITHSDFLIQIIEVKEGDKEIKVKLN